MRNIIPWHKRNSPWMAVWFNLRAWSDRRTRWEKQDAACCQNTACCLFTQAWLSRCSAMKHVLILSNLTMKWPFAVQQGYLYQFCFFTLQEITSLRQANAELTNQNQVGMSYSHLNPQSAHGSTSSHTFLPSETFHFQS